MNRSDHQFGGPLAKNNKKRIGMQFAIRTMLRFVHQFGEPLVNNAKNYSVCVLAYEA